MASKVLLVDDSVTIHRVIDLSIDIDKFEVTKVFSKDEAKQKLGSSHYSYILLDNKLENVRIFDYIKELKSHYPDTKIILLVGAFDKFTDQDLKLSMADDFLVKPFDSQSLNMKLSGSNVEIPDFVNNVETGDPIDIADMADKLEVEDIKGNMQDIVDKVEVEDITSNTQDTAVDEASHLETEDIEYDDKNTEASDKIEDVVNEIDGILADVKELEGTFDDIEGNDKVDVANISNLEDTKIDKVDVDVDVNVDDADQFDINNFKVESAVDNIVGNWDIAFDTKVYSQQPAVEISHETDINDEFDFNDIVTIDEEEIEEVVNVDEEEIFAESKKMIEDTKVEQKFEQSELSKIAEDLDINFVEDESVSKKEDAEKKEQSLKSGLSYLELDENIGSVAKPLSDAKSEKAVVNTIHKELVGNVLYDEVIKPTLSDIIDVATVSKTKGKSVLAEDIKDTVSDVKDGGDSDFVDKVLKDIDFKEEISSVIEKSISKEFLESKINDVLSKSLKMAIEEIVPRLAEKYIIEEINRLKEDE